MTRPPSDGEQRLIRLSEYLLAQHGPEVSVERICEEAGVSKGGFYHHFRSKRDLILFVLTRMTLERRLQVATLLRFLPLARRDRDVARLLRGAASPPPAETETGIDAMLSLGEEIAAALNLHVHGTAAAG